MEYMIRLFGQMPAVEKVILYGSRATGRYSLGSDVDLAIVGRDISAADISHIHGVLENESPTLLWFDVLHYDTLANKKLKDNIDSFGKVIYSRL